MQRVMGKDDPPETLSINPLLFGLTFLLSYMYMCTCTFGKLPVISRFSRWLCARVKFFSLWFIYLLNQKKKSRMLVSHTTVFFVVGWKLGNLEYHL